MTNEQKIKMAEEILAIFQGQDDLEGVGEWSRQDLVDMILDLKKVVDSNQ